MLLSFQRAIASLSDKKIPTHISMIMEILTLYPRPLPGSQIVFRNILCTRRLLNQPQPQVLYQSNILPLLRQAGFLIFF